MLCPVPAPADAFDKLTDRFAVYKVETIGECCYTYAAFVCFACHSMLGLQMGVCPQRMGLARPALRVTLPCARLPDAVWRCCVA